MCGRYALAYAPAALAQRLIADGMPVDEQPLACEVAHGYNIAPGTSQAVYRALGERCAGGPGMRYGLQAMRWGLAPSYPPNAPTAINSRDDALRRSPGPWDTAKHRHRCIVLAQSFFEWRNAGAQRTPHLLKRTDGQLLCLAGLWAPGPGPGHPCSYSIVTTAAAPQVAALHTRMPVVLEPGSEALRAWLCPRTGWGAGLQALCVPWEGPLTVYRVSHEVGNVRNDHAGLVQPAGAGIERFFGRGAVGSAEEAGETSGRKCLELKREVGRTGGVGVKQEEGTDGEWETWPQDLKGEDDTAEIGTKPEPAPATSENTATTAPKRAHDAKDTESPPPPPQKMPKTRETPWVRSATSNAANRRPRALPGKKTTGKGARDAGTPEITRFFKK